MATPVLKAEIRNAIRKSETIKARKAGKVPGVVYSRGADTKEILFDEKEMLKTLSRFGQNVRIGLNLEGEKNYVIIKELQRGSVNRELLHVDFQTLDENEKIKMVMPIQLINREEVETSAQFVQMNINEIEIQTYPKHLPDRIELDATKLKEKDALTVADLSIGENEHIEITEDKDSVVASMTYAQSASEIDEDKAEEDESGALE